jgi:hypothetical protein
MLVGEMIRRGEQAGMKVFGETARPARRNYLRAVSLISGGAMIAACPIRTLSGSELRIEASPAELGQDALPAAAELVGLDEQRAAELLGPAMNIENRAPSNVWHYQSSGCELELVFYMEMRSGRMRTLHYDFKRGAETAAQRQACLAAIVHENLKHGPNIDWPEKNLSAETSVENAAAPAVTANTSSWPSQPNLRRTHPRRYSRSYYGYPVRRSSWGYTASLRYSRPFFGDAALTTGWSGGQFGPAPYSASGP